MSTPTIPNSLRQCLNDAFNHARQHRHEYITLEHLVLAMLREERTRDILQACGANLKKLKSDLETYLEKNLEQLPKDSKDEPTQTVGLGTRLVVCRVACGERATKTIGKRRYSRSTVRGK